LGPPRVLKGDRTAQRITLYFFVFVLLFVGAFGPARTSWMSGPSLGIVFQTASLLLAFVVGALALVRFYSKKTGTYLFIGTGFLGTAVLDTFHAVSAAGLGGDWSRAELRDIGSWSFTASATFLSLFLLVSWLAWRQESRGSEGEEIREIPVYATAAALTLLILGLFVVFFDTLGVSQAFYPAQTLHHPAELFPAFLFLLALAGYLAKGHWRFDSFENWLVVCLIISVMAHGAYMPFSARFHDADFDGAHLLKTLSYASVLIGLLANVYVTFRREEDAAEATREANSALAREIDVRRKAERVLQESEERLQDFLDNAHDLIQSVDPEGRFLYVNRAWKAVLGYDDSDLEDLTFWDIVHPDCRERCRRDFRRVLEGESLPEMKVDFLARSGRVVRCSGSANARLQDGEAVATRSIFRDITEREEARRELEAFQANLQALVENTGDAIWSVDRSLRLITFNSAFSMALEARTGREPGVGDDPETVMAEGDAGWYREMYHRALRGEAFSELRDEEMGGQLRSYELFFNPIREAAGITGVAVFSKDVTARRRTQVALRMAKEEAERANQAKSQFLANMSHELRTPLNSVIGFTNILRKNRSGTMSRQELGFLERIAANGKHLLDLINQVLDLAKIESGRMELDLEPVDLEDLIAETLAQMEGQVKERPVELRARVPEGLAPLETDPGKLKQILINLLGNALKFTEEGEVTVEVSPLGDGRTPDTMAVRDTGIGIPPGRLQAIFEAFQQADGTTTRKYGGTGLGLTISRSICQLLGYDLKVESEVGKGSVFTIVLDHARRDLHDEPGERRSGGRIPGRVPDQDRREGTRGERTRRKERESTGEVVGRSSEDRTLETVLVVDDDPDSRVLMGHLLEDLGCRILTARSAREGLEKARRETPDLITLDLMMPGMTGWEALRVLKDDDDLRDIPVVVVSMLVGGEDGMSFLERLRDRPQDVAVPVVVCTDQELGREEERGIRAHASGVVAKGEGFEEELLRVLSRLFPLEGLSARRDRGIGEG
jgi:PAS domain S-box-containing protein